MMLIACSAVLLQAQTSTRYRELKKIIDANVGYAHATRGVNMYTLVALRTCVSATDIGVLDQMLRDADPIVKMASSLVLVDLGTAGKQAVQAQRDKAANISDRMRLTEALDEAASPAYRPILDYPLSKTERERIRGCPVKSR